MPVEHEEPLLDSGSSQLSRDASQPYIASANPGLYIHTSATPTHGGYNLNTGSRSYHVAAPATNGGHTTVMPPLLLYPANSAAALAPLTAVPMAIDTILVRLQHAFTWSNWARQYAFPLDVPSFANPHLSTYLSAAEWSGSMRRLNAALVWPNGVQLVRLLSLALFTVSIAAMWTKKVRSQKAWTVLCWTCLLLSIVTFVALTKVYTGRVRKRLLEAVETEHQYYSQLRPGRLQSSWRMDGRWLIISAPTTAPSAMMPVSYIMSPPHMVEGGRGVSMQFRHSTETDKEGYEAQHTPMEHF